MGLNEYQKRGTSMIVVFKEILLSTVLVYDCAPEMRNGSRCRSVTRLCPFEQIYALSLTFDVTITDPSTKS